MEYVILSAALFAIMAGVLVLKVHKPAPQLVRLKSKK